MIALDSGPLIAGISLEEGADEMARLLKQHKGEIVIHAVNLLEISYHFERLKDADYAVQILDAIEQSGVEVRGDFDRAFIKDTSFLKVNHKMSLGDTFAVALARRLNCELISTDHHELDAVHAAGVCRVNFIH